MKGKETPEDDISFSEGVESDAAATCWTRFQRSRWKNGGKGMCVHVCSQLAHLFTEVCWETESEGHPPLQPTRKNGYIHIQNLKWNES